MQEVKRMDDVWRLGVCMLLWLGLMLYEIKKGDV